MCRASIRPLSLLVVMAAVASLAGCASLANGTHQQVPVVSNPAGAMVISDCGRGAVVIGETPVVAKLSRKADRCVITLKKDGYRDESIILRRHVSGWLWGNLFLPYVSVPGILVDLYSGSGYRKAPATVRVSLREQTAVLWTPPNER